MSASEAPAPRIRPMRAADLPAAFALQATSYAESLRDALPAFASRLAIGADTCWVAERDGQLLAYILAHPWPSGRPPAVDTVLAPPPSREGCVLYVHDLSVSPRARREGLGRRLFARALEAGRRLGLLQAELVAVQGAGVFWARLGLQVMPVDAALSEKLRSYGADAVYLHRAARIQGGMEESSLT